MEEQRSLDSAYSTALFNLQTAINNCIELAKMWGMTDWNDAMFIKIQQLMDEETKSSQQFAAKQRIMDNRRRTSDELIDNALVECHGRNNKRMRSSTSSISTTAGSSTPASSRGLPTPTSASGPTDEGSPEENGKDEDKEAGLDNYYDCTIDIRECFQPPPPFIFPTHLNDDSD